MPLQRNRTSTQDSLVDSLQQLNLSTQSRETYGISSSRQSFDVWTWSEYLAGSRSFDGIDLTTCTHRQDSFGNTLLITSASFGNESWVTRLLDQGADRNAKNTIGRTALMEAALWGRLNIVTILLRDAANEDLTDVEGNRAFNLAKPVELNSYERYERGEKEHIIERPWLDEQNRLKILELLQPGQSTIVANKAAESRLDYVFFDRSLDGGYTNLVLKFFPTRPEPTRRPKTVARIIDGSISVDAMSGWNHDDQYSIPGTTMWEVLDLAREIRIEFPPHEYDKREWEAGADRQIDEMQPVEGSYYASHAEPQAIAQYVRLRKIRLDVDAVRHSGASDLPAMRDIQIIVSNRVCPVCAEFIGSINSITKRTANLRFVALERYIDESGKMVAREAELL